MNTVSARRTQKSGSSDRRQRPVRTGAPRRRPNSYHAISTLRATTAIAPNISGILPRPCAARAPNPNNAGTAGRGIPTCSATTRAGIITRLYRSSACRLSAGLTARLRRSSFLGLGYRAAASHPPIQRRQAAPRTFIFAGVSRLSPRWVGARTRAVAAPEEPMGPAFEHRRVALLQVGALDRAIEVEGRLLDAFVEFQIRGSGVDCLLACGPRQRPDRRDPRDRIERGVEDEAERVAERERRQERHDQVRPGAGAPDPEGLAHIGRRPRLDTEARRGVDEAAEPEDRVDDKAAQLLAHVVEPPLEPRARDPADRPDVGGHVRHRPLGPVGHHRVVGPRDRLDDMRVQAVVEREGLLVETLPRVVLDARLLLGPGAERLTRAHRPARPNRHWRSRRRLTSTRAPRPRVPPAFDA